VCQEVQALKKSINIRDDPKTSGIEWGEVDMVFAPRAATSDNNLDD
jgi:hypothetical protein